MGASALGTRLLGSGAGRGTGMLGGGGVGLRGSRQLSGNLRDSRQIGGGNLRNSRQISTNLRDSRQISGNLRDSRQVGGGHFSGGGVGRATGSIGRGGGGLGNLAGTNKLSLGLGPRSSASSFTSSVGGRLTENRRSVDDTSPQARGSVRTIQPGSEDEEEKCKTLEQRVRSMQRLTTSSPCALHPTAMGLFVESAHRPWREKTFSGAKEAIEAALQQQAAPQAAGAAASPSSFGIF
mmetsp:Transcript_14650/g.32324  ORF Transcript_14650/g.32324 Transcript_14650/m.32324 type:complete len:237 (-) Transcript_14650:134-844(-)